MRPRLLALATIAVVLVATSCGGSDNSSSATVATTAAARAPASTSGVSPPPTSASGVDPNAPEVVEPGDIPDNQAFVTYEWADGSFSVDVPEGWARTESNGAVTFTDKYNTITIEQRAAATAPTVDSVTTSGLADVSADPTFALTDVQPVTRTPGDGIVARYEIGSAPNPVTGKQALLAVERYVFVHGGHEVEVEVVLTLSGAQGADNVDPWKIVTDSLTWR